MSIVSNPAAVDITSSPVSASFAWLALILTSYGPIWALKIRIDDAAISADLALALELRLVTVRGP
jgi:hypothetical protein